VALRKDLAQFRKRLEAISDGLRRRSPPGEVN
jgi:hypothetical protein